MYMPPESPPLPPKPEVALALLQTAASVYVHLDPRSDSVLVPAWFKTQPQLVLQIGLNLAVPIPDLDVGRESISCTLSFNRRAEFCRIPWEAIYGLVGEDGRGMIWPESVPPEVASAASGRSSKRPPLQVAPEADDKQPAAVKLQPKAKSSSGGKARSGKATQKASKSNSVQGGATSPRAVKREAAALPTSAAQKSVTGTGQRRELPPYLRVVK